MRTNRSNLGESCFRGEGLTLGIGSPREGQRRWCLPVLSVENVDEFHEYLLTQGLQPASEPQNARGNREFILHDPDGYKLVIFKRK